MLRVLLCSRRLSAHSVFLHTKAAISRLSCRLSVADPNLYPLDDSMDSNFDWSATLQCAYKCSDGDDALPACAAYTTVLSIGDHPENFLVPPLDRVWSAL